MARKRPVHLNAQEQPQQQTKRPPTRVHRSRTQHAQAVPSDPIAFAATGVATATAQSLSLSSKLRDQLVELMEMFKSYVALERFVAPEYADEVQAGVPPSRDELGAMLRMFNVAILRQLHALADTLTVLHAQMAITGAMGGGDTRTV